MRYLLISICFIFFGCASFPKKNNFAPIVVTSNIINPYFANPNQDYIYKANIEVYDNAFGGIFIVKKIGDQHHRIVFTTEMGNKLFDFTFNKDDFTVNYILDDLNKKILINVLKKDFKVLITEHLIAEKNYVITDEIIKKTSLDNKTYYYFESPEITKIIRANSHKEKVRFLFTDLNDNIAKHIEIIHSNIKLKINLKSITN